MPDSSAIFQRMKKGLCTNAYFSLTRQPPLSIINERITEQNRKHVGWKPVFYAEQQKKIWSLRKSGLPMRAIAEQMGCSLGTVHRILSQSK